MKQRNESTIEIHNKNEKAKTKIISKYQFNKHFLPYKNQSRVIWCMNANRHRTFPKWYIFIGDYYPLEMSSQSLAIISTKSGVNLFKWLRYCETVGWLFKEMGFFALFLNSISSIYDISWASNRMIELWLKFKLAQKLSLFIFVLFFTLWIRGILLKLLLEFDCCNKFRSLAIKNLRKKAHTHTHTYTTNQSVYAIQYNARISTIPPNSKCKLSAWNADVPRKTNQKSIETIRIEFFSLFVSLLFFQFGVVC